VKNAPANFIPELKILICKRCTCTGRFGGERTAERGGKVQSAKKQHEQIEIADFDETLLKTVKVSIILVFKPGTTTP
jgi:hypothetical protein